MFQSRQHGVNGQNGATVRSLAEVTVPGHGTGTVPAPLQWVMKATAGELRQRKNIAMNSLAEVNSRTQLNFTVTSNFI